MNNYIKSIYKSHFNRNNKYILYWFNCLTFKKLEFKY